MRLNSTKRQETLRKRCFSWCKPLDRGTVTVGCLTSDAISAPNGCNGSSQAVRCDTLAIHLPADFLIPASEWLGREMANCARSGSLCPPCQGECRLGCRDKRKSMTVVLHPIFDFKIQRTMKMCIFTPYLSFKTFVGVMNITYNQKANVYEGQSWKQDCLCLS